MIVGKGPFRVAMFRRHVELDTRPANKGPHARNVSVAHDAVVDIEPPGKRSNGHLTVTVGSLVLAEVGTKGGAGVETSKIEEEIARSGRTIAAAIRKRAWWPSSLKFPLKKLALNRSRRCIWFNDEHADLHIADRSDLADWILVCLDEWLEAR